MPVIIFNDSYLSLEPPTPEEIFGAYRAIIDEHGSAPSLLQMAFSDGETGTLMLDGMGEAIEDGLAQIIFFMEEDPEIQRGWPVWALVCTDSFVAQADTPEALEDLQEDDSLLPELVALGMPGVSQCALVNLVHRDGRLWFAQQLYRLEAEDQPAVWGEIEMLVDETRVDPSQGELTGAVPELLTRLVHHP